MEIICATDADREGESIFRYVYHMAQCRKPVKRLWVSSLEEKGHRQLLMWSTSAIQFSALVSRIIPI